MNLDYLKFGDLKHALVLIKIIVTLKTFFCDLGKSTIGFKKTRQGIKNYDFCHHKLVSLKYCFY